MFIIFRFSNGQTTGHVITDMQATLDRKNVPYIVTQLPDDLTMLDDHIGKKFTLDNSHLSD